MRTLPRVNLDHASGLVDKVVGLGKEIVGTLYDEDRLVTAGTAQQGKGTEKLEALRSQAKAETHRRNASAANRRQRSAQTAKS